MIVKDAVYGDIQIDEPVLLELMNSRPVQRLKRINQAGASKFAIETKTTTRYDHTVGVMLLLKRLGASVEEQIAGLLHDVPHTAFSHVIDFVYKSKAHNFHEKYHEKVVMSSQIPDILKNHGFQVSRLLDEKNYPLMERDIPDLCADRVDYTLRDMTVYKGWKQRSLSHLPSLTVHDNELIFREKQQAKEFAVDFMQMNLDVWAAPREVALFEVLGQAIKIALNENVLGEEDLFMDDDHVFSQMQRSGKKRILNKLEMLNPRFRIKEDPDDYDFHTFTKVRWVDPKFLDGRDVLRVTDAYPEFAKTIESFKHRLQDGYYVKVVSY